jgi:alpha-tubulin suppressor-like RCC1 family protein
MFRYLITIIMALALLPSRVQAASTLHWFAGPNGSITNGTVTVSGSTEFTETLLDYQRSRPITATPNPGYQFRNYSGINFTKTASNPVTTVDNGRDQTITANFSATLLDVITHGVPADVVEMKGGRSHTVLLKKDGTVIAWGGNDGQSNPAIEKLTGVTAIGVGPFNTFLVKDGSVVGYGMFADAKSVSNIPVTVPPLSNVVAVASGLAHAVALKTDGTIAIWCSHDGYRQCSSMPDFQGLKVTAIAAGDNFTLTLMEDGTLRWWGEKKLETGPDPSTLRDVVAISACVWHAAALLKDGTVVGWGEASTGQPPAGLNNVKAIATGGHHTVALKKGGTLVTWGDLYNAKATGGLQVPAALSGLNGLVTAIGTGYYFTLAQTPAAIVAWGENLSNQCNVPARAYLPITKGTVICQGNTPGSTGSAVCNIQPDPGLKTFFAVNGIPRTVPEGPTTTTVTGSQSFQTVTAVFGLPPDPPAIGSVTMVNGQATVQVIPPKDNGGSPITGYNVFTKTPSAALGTDLDAGTTKLSHTITGLNQGTQYTFAATARNLIGTSGESQPSTPGGVAINDDAPYTSSASVTLTLSANDATEVCISNGATCTAWSAYSARKTWLLATGDGPKQVNVWFKDSLGNVSAQPYSASITLDATPPANGTLTIAPAAGAFTLNWQGFTDTGSDIAGYRLVRDSAAYPACTATPLYSGTGESYVDRDLVSGTTYYYRVCAVDKAGNTSTGATAMHKAYAEYDPPTGSVAIIGGSGYIKSPTVTLALSATDASGVAQVCISNTPTCTLWTPFTSTKTWTTTPGSGVKTVRVWFKDSLGNVTPEPYTATATLDLTPPANGTLTIIPAPGAFTLNWQGATDALSDIALYRLAVSTTGYPACSATPLYSGVGNSYLHKGVVTGTTYYYRLCAVDKAGNTSAGALAMKKALAEYDPPVGTVVINNSAGYTRSPTVSLTLSATDASGVAQVCISNTATCALWSPYAAARTWTLLPGNGKKTVKVWYKDKLGNVNQTPYSADIILDATPPTSGTLTITPAVGAFTLNWQGATDAQSGIAGYRLVSGTVTYPACTATPIYTGTGNSFVHNVTVGTTYYYRLCTLDNAGNTSAGAIAMKKAVAEYDPPVGSVVINKGAAYTRSASVTLALSATDASGVSQVCVSNSANCTLWSTYAATKTWLLPLGNGPKTVNVWFKDRLGNANLQPYSATITLDTMAPTGTVSINDGAASTTTTAVTLTLSATDKGSTVSSMQFSNDGITWSAWESYATSKAWTLTTAPGLKTVRARFMDAAGNTSAATYDTITLLPASP